MWWLLTYGQLHPLGACSTRTHSCNVAGVHTYSPRSVRGTTFAREVFSLTGRRGRYKWSLTAGVLEDGVSG